MRFSASSKRVIQGLSLAAFLAGSAGCAGSAGPPSAPRPAAPPPPTPPKEVATPAPRFAEIAAEPADFVDAARSRKLLELVPKLEKAIDDFYDAEKPPSLAVAMVVDGKTVLSRVRGVRDLATKEVATANTLYRIGSISKTFTATLVLSLRDAGLVRLDDAAETYLPELAKIVYPHRDAPRITLRHLLTHTSGLPRIGDFDYTREVDVTEDEMLDAVGRASLDRVPGMAHAYSNFGMSLVGAIVARRSPEKALRAALAAHVTTPLGMTHTTFDPKTLADAEPATGYASRGSAKPAPPWHLGASEAAGGLWSSLDDMSKWIALQLAAWPPRSDDERGPVKRASLREAHLPGFFLALSSQAGKGTNADGIGLAWHTHTTCAYERIVEHGGAIDGFHSNVAFAPERGFGFIILASSLDTPTAKLQEILLEASAGLPPREERPARQTAELLERLAGSISLCDEASYEVMFASSFRKSAPYGPVYAPLCRKLSARHGACRLGRVLSLATARSGDFELACERGALRATATVIDEGGRARFSGLLLEGTGFAPSKDALRAAGEVLRLRDQWDDARFQSVFAGAIDKGEIRRGFEPLRVMYGACKLAPEAAKSTRGGDRNSAVLPLRCERGEPVDLSIDLDEKGKVSAAYWKQAPRPERRCLDRDKR